MDQHLENVTLNDKFLENYQKEENPLSNSVLHFVITHCAKGIYNQKMMFEYFMSVNETNFKAVNINTQNKNGESVLHLCCRQLISPANGSQSKKNDLIDIAKYLVLKCGADINLKNTLGDSPLDIASRNQNHDLVMIFNSIYEQSTRVSQHQQIQFGKSQYSNLGNVSLPSNDYMEGPSSLLQQNP